MATVNYLLATWSGKRRNPSKDYLRAQIEQLSKLVHHLDQVTVIRPKGSDDPEYYGDFESGHGDYTEYVLLDRPTNDRAYGQFLFAYQQEAKFDYYILVEDDYLPNLDNFDQILIDLLHQKGADYLCGSYGSIVPGGPVVPRHNIGIITGDGLRRILKKNPHPYFHPNGENDGQEQEMFAKLCTDAGLEIADYSEDYPVPYYDRYLRYFSKKRGKETLFVPYQLLHHKAFGYHGEEGDENSHFLSTMEFFETAEDNILTIHDGTKRPGILRLKETTEGLEVKVEIDHKYPEYERLAKDRIEYMARGRKVTFL